MADTKTEPDSVLTPSPTKRTTSWRLRRDLPIVTLLLIGFLFVHKVFDVAIKWQLAYGVFCLVMVTGQPYARMYYTLLVIKPLKLYAKRIEGKIWLYDRQHRRWYRRDVIPLTSHGIPSVDNDTLGLVHNRRHKIDSVILTADGWGTAALNLDGQFRNHRLLAEIYKELTGLVDGFSIGISQVHLRLPQNLPVMASILAELNHPDINDWWGKFNRGVAEPDELLNDEQICDKRLGEYQAGLLAATDSYTTDLVTALVISVYRDEEVARQQRRSAKQRRRERKPATLSQQEIDNLPAPRLARHALNRLTAIGVVKPRPLNQSEVSDFLRGWDIRLRQQYFAGSLDYQDPKKQALDSVDRQHPHSHVIIWREPIRNNLQAILDGTHWAVFVLERHEAFLPPSFYSELRALPARYFAFTLIGTTLRSDVNVKAIEIGDTLLSDFRTKVREGDEIGRTARRRDDERSAQADQLEESGFVLSYNVVVAIGEVSSQALEPIVSRVQDFLGSKGVKPERVNEEAVIVDYLLSALFGQNLL